MSRICTDPWNHRAPSTRPAPDRHAEEHTLKADPFAQLKLLDLQAVDAGLDQLAHQLKNLPEHAAPRRALGARGRRVRASWARRETEVSDLEREQRKADADVEQVKTRRSRNQERIDGGHGRDPKQLQAMQHEIVALDKRISDLEDEELRGDGAARGRAGRA